MWVMMMATAAASVMDLMRLDLDWVCVNDTVMGGVSQSQVSQTPDGQRFTGTLSLENNGGFTSVRTAASTLPLAGTTGFRVTVQGDGRTYDFTVRRGDIAARGLNYRASVETDAQAPTTVELPLSVFRPTAYGRPVNAPPLEAEQISSVGFLLADKQPGQFALEILSIETITQPIERREAPDDPRAAVQQSFLRAIERGVPLFNEGNAAQCAAVYQTAVESVLILASGQLADEEYALLAASLDQARQQDAVRAAWTLRYAMDAVLLP